MRPMESETDLGGKAGTREERPRPWLGFRSMTVGDRVMIRTVMATAAAAAAGLSANDEIVALDGNRVTAKNWNDLLDRLAVNDTAVVTVFRRDELRRFEVDATLPPRDTCYLTVEPDVDADIVDRRQAWLGD